MPKNINKVELQGHLGKDPELRYTQSGTAFCKFSIATTDRRKNKQTGEYENGDTHWHNITVWGSSAERAAEIFKKGDCCHIIEGKIAYSKKDDKFYTNIIAFKFEKVLNTSDRTGPLHSTEPVDDDIPF